MFNYGQAGSVLLSFTLSLTLPDTQKTVLFNCFLLIAAGNVSKSFELLRVSCASYGTF